MQLKLHFPRNSHHPPHFLKAEKLLQEGNYGKVGLWGHKFQLISKMPTQLLQQLSLILERRLYKIEQNVLSRLHTV